MATKRKSPRKSKGKKPSKPKPPRGSGERFAQLEESLRKQGAKNPRATAARIGINRYGQKQMTAWAVAGKRRKKLERQRAAKAKAAKKKIKRKTTRRK